MNPPGNSYIKVTNTNYNTGLKVKETTIHHRNEEPLTIDITNTTDDTKYIQPRTHIGNIMYHKYLVVDINIDKDLMNRQHSQQCDKEKENTSTSKTFSQDNIHSIPYGVDESEQRIVIVFTI